MLNSPLLIQETGFALRPLDKHFARCLAELFSLEDELLLTLFAFVSYQMGMGHSCVPLNALPKPFSERPLEHWYQCFKETAAVGVIASTVSVKSATTLGNGGTASTDGIAGTEGCPIILDGGRLYLGRFHRYECLIAQAIQARINRTASVDWVKLNTQLDYYFPPTQTKTQEGAPKHRDWQRLAVAGAVKRAFSVIIGGPGTGKTTTVAKLLAVLVTLSIPRACPRIVLCAPTGKAAARLAESIKSAKESLKLPKALDEQIPDTSFTVHRLLGVTRDGKGFRHHSQNPLHCDWLIVDEASMVDVSLMAHLLEALPASAGVILLGDTDQLASVETGSVLADLCASLSAEGSCLSAEGSCSSAEGSCSSAEGSSINAVFELKRSFRFRSDSGIGYLAGAIQQKDHVRLRNWVYQQTEEHSYEDLKGFWLKPPVSSIQTGPIEQAARQDNPANRGDLHEIPVSSLDEKQALQNILQQATQGYQSYLDAIAKDAEPSQILQIFHSFQVLCAYREGVFGVETLNQALERYWVSQGLLNTRGEFWYPGKAIMVNTNDYRQQLFNGDIGVCLPSKEENSRLRVFFENPKTGLRSVLPSRLSNHDSVYAMTIHKSQGSEFDEVLMVLPNTAKGLLTRELVYTGLTRARKALSIYYEPDTLMEALQRSVKRCSGLAERLFV